MDNQRAKSIAFNYISEYPITRYMDGRHIDYARAAVRAATDIRVIFVGFDKVAREMLIASLVNDQLIGISNKGLEKLQVKYYILSPEAPWDSLADYCRYEREFLNNTAIDRSKYFELPEKPAGITHIAIGAQGGFIKDIRKLLSPIADSLPCFRIIVSEGMCSAKLLNQIKAAVIGTGAAAYTTLFAVAGEDIPLPDNVIRVADDINAYDNYEKAAIERNRIYYEDTAAADAKWAAYNDTARDSNILAVINMRLKLNLLGLDFAIEGASETLSEKEYRSLYFGSDNLIFDDTEQTLIISLEISSPPRAILAAEEHLRWNAFMISRGYVPAQKADCLDASRGYGKSEELKIHRNLTTFNGLIEYRRYMADMQYQTKGGDYEALEAAADVIKYDFQLLDDAYRVLARLGKCIIRRG